MGCSCFGQKKETQKRRSNSEIILANPNQSNETKKTIDSANQNIIKEKINQINNNKNKNTIKEKIALKSGHNPNKKESNKINLNEIKICIPNQNMIKENINSINNNINEENVKEEKVLKSDFNLLEKESERKIDSNYINIEKSQEIYPEREEIYIRDPLKDLENFASEIIIQDTFFKREEDNNKKDELYIKLKAYEKEQLTRAYNDNFQNFLNVLNNNKVNIKLEKKLIGKILKIENCEKVLINKIKAHIEKMKEKVEEFEIKNLNILIVGKRNIGKKDLIKYILKIDNDNELKKDKTSYFKEYKSKKEIKYNLIKYKGIGYSDNNDPEIIKTKTDEFIRSRLKTNDPNEFIHCIWYCINKESIEPPEFEYLQKLKKVYESDCLPIIMVYLQGDISEEMKNEIKKNIKLSNNQDEVEDYFQNIIAKEMEVQKDEESEIEVVKPKGDKKLLETTNELILKAFKGPMQKIMTLNLRNDIKKRLNEKNNEIKEIMIDFNIKNFINEYYKVMNNTKFINYLLNILGRCLNKLLDEKKKISNRSLNLIIASDNMNYIKNYINDYKNDINKIIDSIINLNIENFIDKQVELEKSNEINIEIKNKRTLKGFRNTSEIFLKENFYYMSQKYVIKEIIKYCQKSYYDEFINQIDNIIKKLLNENEGINKSIYKYFLENLNNFNLFKINKEENKTNIIKENINSSAQSDENYEIDENDEKLKISESDLNNNKSFEIDLNFNEKLDYESKINIKYVYDNIKNKLFKFEKKSKYFDDNLSEKLYNFIFSLNFKKNIIFTLNKEIDINFISLLDFIKNDLEIFCENNKYDFIDKLRETQKNKFTKQALIDLSNSIILNYAEEAKFINSMLKDKFKELKNDESFCKIDYITIIPFGKTGVGKSTLINALLKEYLAPETNPKIGTIKPKAYSNEKVKFLKFIDTRGVELIKNYGNENIAKQILQIINDPNSLDFFEWFKKKNYNDNIQCLWYCVNDKKLDTEDETFIKTLEQGQNKIPIVVVFTKTKDINVVKLMQKDIENKLGNLPFIHIRAKNFGDLKSYGLEKLVDLTLNQCKLAVKGNIFNDIKDIIYNKLIDEIKKENEKIKFEVNENIANIFFNSYNKVILDTNMYHKYIHDLCETIIEGYIKKGENPNYLAEFNNSLLTNYINEYIDFYKKETQKIIDSIKEKKAIKYLNIQVIIEKTKGTNLNIKNKCNKNEFIQIIQINLQNIFYYIAQKFFIYQLIFEFCNYFSEMMSENLNKTISGILNSPEASYLFEDVYQQKIEDLRKITKLFYAKEKENNSKNLKEKIELYDQEENNNVKRADCINCNII